MSLRHSENQNPLLNLLIICISARPAPQILSVKDECTFYSFFKFSNNWFVL